MSLITLLFFKLYKHVLCTIPLTLFAFRYKCVFFHLINKVGWIMDWNSHWNTSALEQTFCGRDEDTEKQRREAIPPRFSGSGWKRAPEPSPLRPRLVFSAIAPASLLPHTEEASPAGTPVSSSCPLMVSLAKTCDI